MFHPENCHLEEQKHLVVSQAFCHLESCVIQLVHKHNYTRHKTLGEWAK